MKAVIRNQDTMRKRAEEETRLHENRLKNLLDLHRLGDATEKEIFDFTLEAGLRTVPSEFALVGIISADEAVMIIHAWSRGAMGQCAITENPIHFPIAEAGLWGEIVRQRRPIIVNDYDTSTGFKRGYPEGHVPIKRFLGIPIFSADRIVAVAAVANKVSEYTESDVSSLTSLLHEMWNLIDRKRAEEALRKSEELYRSLFDGVSIGLYRTTSTGQIIDANPALVQMLGYPNRESLLAINAGDTYANLEDRIKWQTFMDLEGIVRNYEKQIRRRDAKIIWVEENARTVRDAEGRLLYYEGSFQDITERKRAEEDLRRSKLTLQQLFDEAPVGYYEVDNKGIITRANRTELEMLGYKSEEMVGHPVWKFIKEEENIRQVFFGKIFGKIPPGRAYEHRFLKKDGTSLPVLSEDRLLRDKEGKITGIRVTIQDISERKHAEKEMAFLQEQFRQSQKMEAIGHLAGGIAHDFNNLLTIIKGYSQLSLIELKEGDPLQGNIEEVKKATDRAADLIRQLLAFSRRQVMEMRVLDLNILLQNLNQMLRRVIGEDIELVTLLAEDLGRVKTDPGQIEQVIMNLAVNARDAMLSGGKLTIETANVELDGAYGRRHVAVTPGRYVMLAVSDTGVGMTPEVRGRVFEPFFTTKEKGKGTGLGLSTVYGIVKQSEGNIWVYSEPGHGTTFKIYLPQAEELLEEVKEKVVEEELPCGSETVLVVEDEEEVRKVAARILRGQGYKVLEASNGADTLMICKEQKDPIHLILTDVVMPQMSGRQLVEQLRQVYQNFKVLYMSGYTDNTIVHHGVLERGINYIQKPFTMGALAGKVREVLDNKEG